MLPDTMRAAYATPPPLLPPLRLMLADTCRAFRRLLRSLPAADTGYGAKARQKIDALRRRYYDAARHYAPLMPPPPPLRALPLMAAVFRCHAMLRYHKARAISPLATLYVATPMMPCRRAQILTKCHALCASPAIDVAATASQSVDERCRSKADKALLMMPCCDVDGANRVIAASRCRRRCRAASCRYADMPMSRYAAQHAASKRH